MAEENSSTGNDSEDEEDLIKLNQKFVIKLSNQNNQIIEKSAKQSCKVLQISSELDIDQQLAVISTLEPSEYPNLFIFIFNHQNVNSLNENEGTKAKQLEDHLIKFGNSRPLVVLHTFEAEKETKFYYKAEKSTKFVDIDQHYSEDLGLYEEYTTSLLSLLNDELEPFEDQILKKLSYIKDSSIILRFLRTLDIQEAYFGTIIFKIAKNGSKADLLAVLDASFDENGRMLSKQAQNYIRWDYENTESTDDDQQKQDSGSENLSDGDQDVPNDLTSSVILTAVQHSNCEIINFLIAYWSPLIQQLPVDHQIRVSTVAFDIKQFNVLCDLLSICDFPFPDKFTFTKSKIDENLRKITDERMDFKASIEREDFEEIDKFIDNNQSHKFIYSIDNNSALTEAIKTRQFSVFYYLKSLGFQGENCKDILNGLTKEEASAAIAVATEQRKTNIQCSLINYNRSVYNLCGKSLIHNRKISKELEAKYREFIKNWFICIHKIAPEMLDVAASCEHLKIIFDFESHTVENASLEDPSSLGTSYSTEKWIFIGAKFTKNAQEQKVKGVLAHELCHYVMGMVYENEELPYYKGDKKTAEIFKEIVAVLDKWSTSKSIEPDDECDGIISTVYRRYKSKDFEPELIVRVVNILAQYGDDPGTTDTLQTNYQILFDFWYNHVVPEMLNYFMKDKVAIRVNATVGLLKSLSNTGIELSSSKDMEQLMESKTAIVTTNVPRLLLINIYSHLEKTCGYLMKSQNLFLKPDKIMNEQVWMDLKDLHFRDVKLNVFVDCTKGNLADLSYIFGIKEFNFILIADNEKQTAKLRRICNKSKINPVAVDINYKWNDLTEDSQLYLLETEVKFQNNTDLTLMELLSKPTDEDKIRILGDFSEIINDQLFNLLVDEDEICLNSSAENEQTQNKLKVLYQQRKFLKKGVNFKNEISQEKLISITENHKHVLISDIAGSGKSWVVKNISKIIMNQTPTKWVTYVDLKEFIEELKQPVQNLDFPKFFVEKILKPKTEFEGEIFRKLYKIGKISIIFDGFDEIAPDCAEFVADLAKSFESNDGNQLWIVTRDYFEVNLQEKLGIKNVYKLSEFTEEEGIDFIATSWILMDLKVLTGINFEKFKQNSPNLTKYQEKATKIVQIVTVSKNQSIGLPQLFSMITSSYKDDNYIAEDLKRTKIFTQFVNKMYKRWIYEKGDLNIERNVNSQHYMLGFIKFHQYCAIASLFPEFVDILFPNYDKSEWPETEIIACGIIIKIIGSIYSFVHETFREFFVADFIFKSIKDPKIKSLLVQVLTSQKCGIIRMFLNDFMDNYSALEMIQLELDKSVEKIYNMENFSELFAENQEHLAKFIIEILKKMDYENVKRLISVNFKAVATKTKEFEMFLIFLEFTFSFLKDEDIMDIITDQNILHKMIELNQDLKIFKKFILKLEAKFSQKVIQQKLTTMLPDHPNGNILYHLAKAENLSQKKVEQFFKIIPNYLIGDEILELMENCNCCKNTIFKTLIKNSRNFKPFLDGSETYFKDRKLFFKIKNIVFKTDLNGQHILHWSANIDDIELHESLWNLIKKIFENKQELGAFVLQKNFTQNNFLHILIENNKSGVIELTLIRLREILMPGDYQKILRSNEKSGKNLLQIAAKSKEVETFKNLWMEIKNLCKFDEEFLEILGEIDDYGLNVFGLTAALSTAEILKFIHEELKKIGLKEKVKKLLTNLGFSEQNILKLAAALNKSLDAHKILWEILKNYFSPLEIFEFINNYDLISHNLLLIIRVANTTEILEFTWNEIKDMLNNNFEITDEQKENIEKCEKIIKLNSKSVLESNEIELLNLKWMKNGKNFDDKNLFGEATQKIIEQNLKVINLENFQILLGDKNIENHKKVWEKLALSKDCEIIEKLATEVAENGYNYIQHLIIFNTAEIVEFTFNKFKENLQEQDYNKLLRSKEEYGKDLLKIAAQYSNDVKVHEIILKKMQNCCKNNEEFFEILTENDKNGNNVFHIAAGSAKAEIFEFLYQELIKIASSEKIKNILIKFGNLNQNLLQTAARENKSLELYKIIWKIIKENFNSIEILGFITNYDNSLNNLLINAKKSSPREILQFIWTEIKEYLEYFCKDTPLFENIDKCEKLIEKIMKTKVEDENSIVNIIPGIELLQLDWIENPKSKSLNETLRKTKEIKISKDLVPFIIQNNIAHHKILWNDLKKSFESKNLAKLMLEKYETGVNFMNGILILNTPEVIEFTIKNLKEKLNESDFREVLLSKGLGYSNSLKMAAIRLKDIKIHQILWKEYRNVCKSDEAFFAILEDVDEFGNNFLGLAARFSSAEIFEFLINEVEKIASKEKVKKLLTNLKLNGENILYVAQKNGSLEFHEFFWKVLKNYFNSFEILEFIKYQDTEGVNLLSNPHQGNIKEVLEFTWNKVREILVNIGYESNDNLKLTDEIIKNNKKIYELTKEERKVLKFEWIDTKSSLNLIESSKKIKNNEVTTVKCRQDLMLFYADKNYENHEILWNKLEENFKSYDELKKLLFEMDEESKNYIQFIVGRNSSAVVNFTLNKHKENLNEADYKEILRLEGYCKLNLLQIAATASRNIEIFKILWHKYRENCKTNEEFLKILEKTDAQENNIFHHAVVGKSFESFKFMISELEKSKNEKELKKFLASLGLAKKNLLQCVVLQCYNLETHKTIWQLFSKYFNNEEILEFIKFKIMNGNNLLFNAVCGNTKEIVEFTWNQIEKFITSKEAQLEYLNELGYENQNLHQLSLRNVLNDSRVTDYVQQMMLDL